MYCLKPENPGVQQGHTTNYLPIRILCMQELQGHVCCVRITDVQDAQLVGELLCM